jgi:hypothetical protein
MYRRVRGAIQADTVPIKFASKHRLAFFSRPHRSDEITGLHNAKAGRASYELFFSPSISNTFQETRRLAAAVQCR